MLRRFPVLWVLVSSLVFISATAEDSYLRVARTVDEIEKGLADAKVDRVFVPAGVYRLGAKTLRMRTGSTLECANPETTVLIYEGGDAGIVFDSVAHATLANCQIRVLSKGPARAIAFLNTTGDNKWNLVRHVSVQGAPLDHPVPRQVGLAFEASTKYALYWNVVEFLTAMNLDIGIKLSNAGIFSVNGANDNTFVALSSHHCRIGMEISRYSTENRVFGLSGSASGYPGENTLLVVGDKDHAAADFNMVFGLVSDQGTHGQAWNIYKGVQDTYIQGTDQSGITPIDAGSNSVITRNGDGPSAMTIPELHTRSAVPEPHDRQMPAASMQHMHAALGCTTEAAVAAACTSPEFLWGSPFPSADYTMTCTLTGVSGQPHIVGTHQARSGFTVTIANDRAEASTANVACVAIADR
ncbi:MAG TPA: hypothetical protein VHQ22_04300 [Terriglobales bacterium]|jgi:hypothetical protein|nr:hypothetical protein [Terriglobales bacterium]